MARPQNRALALLQLMLLHLAFLHVPRAAAAGVFDFDLSGEQVFVTRDRLLTFTGLLFGAVLLQGFLVKLAVCCIFRKKRRGHRNVAKHDGEEWLRRKSGTAQLPRVLGMLAAMEPEARLQGDLVKEALQYATLDELFCADSRDAAFEDTSTRTPLDHALLAQAIRQADLGLGPGERLACVVPNGAEAGVLLLSCLTRCCVVPLNPTGTKQETLNDCKRVKAKKLVVHRDFMAEARQNQDFKEVVAELGISLVQLVPDEQTAGLFNLILEEGTGRENSPVPSDRLNHEGDTVLVLFTSGTSGSKKCVPYSLDMLVVGATNIIASWKLRPTDKVCNMMPLFHVGGILRNLLSPVLSGGSAILCNFFDPVVFWDVVEDHNNSVTWYYAGPTMHQMILDEFQARGRDSYAFRFIANAAGGLLPSLAVEMRRAYGCTVLPGYGMTECMPISAPPLNYKLEREGTSGRRVGPEISIFNEEGQDVPVGVVGHVCVRGLPCFKGYEGDDEATREAFFPGGWFKTGDLGSLDRDGYLYITGRSKEVINRGGEIISPFEIEEALQAHPYVKAAMAFSVPHSVLQEAVGVAVVPVEGKPEVSLRSVQQHCRRSLSSAKWPVVLVIMPDLPKNHADKLQRVNMSARLGLENHWGGPLIDGLHEASCTFHAPCPPKGTPLNEKVPNVTGLLLDTHDLSERLLKAGEPLGVREAAVVVAGEEERLCACVAPDSVDCKSLLEKLRNEWHEWETPLVLVALTALPRFPAMGDRGAEPTDVDEVRLAQLLELEDPDYVEPTGEAECRVQQIWQEALGLERISATRDYWELGGTSLLAGPLANALREEFGVPFTVSDIFAAPTVRGVTARVLEQRVDGGGAPGESMDYCLTALSEMSHTPVRREKNWTSTHPIVILEQMLPLFVFQPLRRVLGWTCFLHLHLHAQRDWGIRGFFSVMFAVAATDIGMSIVMPTVGIILKWLIAGRLKPGQFPIFGSTYLKWWLANSLLLLNGRGVYLWNLPLYYRLLGATVGKGVRISTDAELSEPDLLHIGDHVVLDACTVRPFNLNPNGNYSLRPIVLGEGSAVCAKTVIAAGARVPMGTCLGPLSSSHELRDAAESHRATCQMLRRDPPLWIKVLCGFPWLALQFMFGGVPALLLVLHMVPPTMESMGDLLNYFADYQRMGYYILIRLALKIPGPFLQLFVAIVAKHLVIGKFKETPPGREPEQNAWQLFRPWFFERLVPDGHLCGVTRLMGKHFEAVSFLFRLVGVKVGKRVYWPGTGFKLTEPDLIDIGDYVVFGSRSHLFTSDASNRRSMLRIEAGANVSDRCVLLPGVTVKSGAVLGSGSLTRPGAVYAAGTYVGSRGGDCVLLKRGNGPEDFKKGTSYANTFSRPAEAVLPPYCVIPEYVHILWCIFCQALSAGLNRLPIVVALFFGRIVYQNDFRDAPNWELFLVLSAFLSIAYIMVVGLIFVLDIASKWIIIGTRRPGSYSWHESSYNQRWQLYLAFANIRGFASGGNDVLDLIRGSRLLVWYFKALGAKIGHDVCLYPNGASPMMTEPDLVTIHDGACIDDALLVAHLNTAGKFTLNTLEVGPYAVMRTFSRLQQSGTLQKEAVLLDHTLVLPGDTVEEKEWRQGWPSAHGKVKGAHAAVRLSPRSTPRLFKALPSPHGPISPRSRRSQRRATRSPKGLKSIRASALEGLGGGLDVDPPWRGYRPGPGGCLSGITPVTPLKTMGPDCVATVETVAECRVCRWYAIPAKI